MAIWVMPSGVYALANDTLIGVVRAWAVARMRADGQALEGEEATPLAVAGAVPLWLLRLALAPASTLSGFRRWTYSRSWPRRPVMPSNQGEKRNTAQASHRQLQATHSVPPSQKVADLLTVRRADRTRPA
jgi:hypothetical protein